MPYEVAGNAAAGYAQTRRWAGRGRSGGDASSTAMCILCCPCFVGFILTIVGFGHLMDATNDSRGQELQEWHDEMAKWERSGLENFKSRQYSVSATLSPAPPAPPPGTSMVGTASNYGPAYFGESSFDVREPQRILPKPKMCEPR
eukprot:SAG31_NODE_2807_length_5065_cov_3.438180_1_plen_145_part_00